MVGTVNAEASSPPSPLDAVEVVDESDGSVYVFVATGGKSADELVSNWQANGGPASVIRRGPAGAPEPFSLDDVRTAIDGPAGG